jgi:hypothetical protein
LVSFDLAFWYEERPSSADRGWEIYERLAEGETGVTVATSHIEDFVNDVLAVYPDLTDETLDESPFNSAVYRTSECAITAISWERAEEVGRKLLELAREHALTAYDPQNRTLHQP